MGKPRVMAILLDGAPFNVFNSLARKGVLPAIRKLMKKGCFSLLKSTIPSSSPVAIPSMLTGKNPGKHGMFGFGYMENGSFRPYTSMNIAGETIWDILTRCRKKVILLNVPWTYPRFEVNGIMVSGPPSPENKVESYPSEIVSVIESEIGRYYVDLNVKTSQYKGADEESFVSDAYLVTRKRAKAMYYLMRNYEWDLFFATFTTLDRMQHVFYGYYDEHSPFFDQEKRKILVRYYEEIDKILSKTVSLLDEKTFLVVVSDHGFEYLAKHIGLNNILVQNGFAIDRSQSRVFTTKNIANFLERIGLENLVINLSRRAIHVTKTILPTRIDYSKSLCWSVPGNVAISINKNNAIVREKPEAIKRRLTEFLYSIRDKSNGEKIFEKVYDRNEIYSGNHVCAAPDLIMVPKEGYEPKKWIRRTIEPVKPVKTKTVKTASHVSFAAQRGILIVSGPGVKEGYQTEAEIVDVTPTLLHILGVPIPHDTDGKVLKQIFKPRSRLSAEKVRYQRFLTEEKKYKSSKEEEEAIKDRLRKLGYI